MNTNSRQRALVLTGEGINCERETAAAFEKVGIESSIIHVDELIKRKEKLAQFDVLALPGGFSYGDELGSGKVLALKLKKNMLGEIQAFIASKRPVIGICNGFQALVHLGVFSQDDNKNYALVENNHGQFINKWVGLKVTNECESPWLTRLQGKEIVLPIRHGEGRFIAANEKLIQVLEEKGMKALTYTTEVNGSWANIAGVTNETGLVFGLMPHPEAAVSTLTYPYAKDSLENTPGLLFFNSIKDYLDQRNINE